MGSGTIANDIKLILEYSCVILNFPVFERFHENVLGYCLLRKTILATVKFVSCRNLVI